MKKQLVGFLITLLVFTFSSSSEAVATRFSQVAYQSTQQIFRDLQRWGLLEMNPWHPSLPRPQVPALKAIVSRTRGLLAYYDEENGWGATSLVFKNPNGSYPHSVTFDREGIRFVTPFKGTVAHANRFMTVNGPGFNFYCQSRLVTEQNFYYCIDRLFTEVIVRQLIRYAK